MGVQLCGVVERVNSNELMAFNYIMDLFLWKSSSVTAYFQNPDVLLVLS